MTFVIKGLKNSISADLDFNIDPLVTPESVQKELILTRGLSFRRNQLEDEKRPQSWRHSNILQKSYYKWIITCLLKGEPILAPNIKGVLMTMLIGFFHWNDVKLDDKGYIVVDGFLTNYGKNKLTRIFKEEYGEDLPKLAIAEETT